MKLHCFSTEAVGCWIQLLPGNFYEKLSVHITCRNAVLKNSVLVLDGINFARIK